MTIVVLGSLVIGGLAVLSAGPRDRVVPLVGRVAPAISGLTLEGQQIDLAAWRGRWVVVNFFAPWCTECIVEQPELQSLQRRLGGDVRVVSVVVDSPVEDVIAYRSRHRADWPFVLDPNGRTGVAYGQAKVPETYLIAPDSTVVAKFEGAITAMEVEAAVRGPQP